MGDNSVCITLVPVEDRNAVAEIWCELETRSSASYFNTWAWIGTWLRLLPPDLPLHLLQASSDGRVVGAALLAERNVMRHGVLRARSLFLHETGDPAFDELTVEFNGILAEAGQEARVMVRCLEYLAGEVVGWDELVLSGLAHGEMFDQFSHPATHCNARVRPVYYVDIAALRAASRDYLDVLEKDIRYQIRRALRECEKCGPLRTVVSGSLSQAEAFFAGLRELHQAYWTSKGMPGSFANTHFARFHQELIRTRFAHGEIQLVQVAAGDTIVGYLYNFVHRARVYQYQSGFNYATFTSNQSRPGFVCHYQAIEFNLETGAQAYDLMAGDSRYKRNLGTHSGQMHWVVLQRDRLKFRVERYLKRLVKRNRSARATVHGE